MLKDKKKIERLSVLEYRVSKVEMIFCENCREHTRHDYGILNFFELHLELYKCRVCHCFGTPLNIPRC